MGINIYKKKSVSKKPEIQKKASTKDCGQKVYILYTGNYERKKRLSILGYKVVCFLKQELYKDLKKVKDSEMQG